MNSLGPYFILRLFVLLLLVALITQNAAAKRTDDVVTMENGDRMTGEIKRLEQGELSFKANYMLDAVTLDWKRVAGLESKDQFLVILTNGNYLTGRVELVSGAGASDVFTIQQGSNRLSVPPLEVFRIRPAEQNFWHQLEGTVDFGLGYTSGNEQSQANLSASATYRQEGYTVTASLDSAYSGQSGARSSNRNEVAVVYRKALSPKWFAGALVDFMNSSQQSLDLRSTGGGMVGRYLKRSDRTTLSVAGGMVFTRERYSEAAGLEPRQNNAEGLIGMDAHTYRFKTLDFSARVLLFPSVSNAGRVRMGFRSGVRVEIVRNFYLSFNTYDNYDSRPPGIAKKNDLGISTSVGWKF